MGNSLRIVQSWKAVTEISAMMDEIYNDCFAKKIQTLTLEVRVGNIPAINFYKKYGFEIEVTKPHYYDNGEDAYYMILKVK